MDNFRHPKGTILVLGLRAVLGKWVTAHHSTRGQRIPCWQTSEFATLQQLWWFMLLEKRLFPYLVGARTASGPWQVGVAHHSPMGQPTTCRLASESESLKIGCITYSPLVRTSHVKCYITDTTPNNLTHSKLWTLACRRAHPPCTMPIPLLIHLWPKFFVFRHL